MADFNDIGIPRQLDWPWVRKLLTIGVFGALLHLAGDLILGWGVEDESLTGLFRMLSAYTATSDGGILASALLGLFGMTLEGLSFFGVYRLMAERSPKDAHRYRSGILGYLIFGACGFHVPTCALVFLARQGLPVLPPARHGPLLGLLPAAGGNADRRLRQGLYALPRVVLGLLAPGGRPRGPGPGLSRQPPGPQRHRLRLAGHRLPLDVRRPPVPLRKGAVRPFPKKRASYAVPGGAAGCAVRLF